MPDKPNSGMTTLSAAAIAAAVPKSNALRSKETELLELRARRRQLGDAMRVQAARFDGLHHEETQKSKMDAFQRQVADLDQKITAARAALDPYRKAHAAEVRDALAPMREGAARLVIKAIDDLRQGIQLLDDAADQLLRAGGEATRVPAPFFGAIESIALRISANA